MQKPAMSNTVHDEEGPPIGTLGDPDASPARVPSALESFKHHLAEMEVLLARGIIDWSEVNAAAVFARLEKLTQEVGRIGAKHRDQAPPTPP